MEIISELDFEGPRRKCIPGRKDHLCFRVQHRDGERICRVWVFKVGRRGSPSGEIKTSEHRGHCTQCQKLGLDLKVGGKHLAVFIN